MKINNKPESIYTAEGTKAIRINAEQMLRRSVMSCLLWEKSFYEDGQSVADRIASLVPQVEPKKVIKMAVEAKEKMNLRHVPLLLVREMARHATHKRYVSRTLQRIIQRPDDLTEFMAIYWKDGKCPVAAKVKQGLSFAFQKFDEYQLAKYNREDKIKLRDVLFLCHSKPKDKDSEELYKKLINNNLKTPDTWEVALSGGADKKETFERLMAENKLGALAFIRNLRKMTEVSVDVDLIKKYSLSLNVSRILPFQFIAAANNNPRLEDTIEQMMFRCTAELPKLKGRTILLVDVSGSMQEKLSKKSELTRLDAALGLGMLLRELCEHIQIFSFSQNIVEVPNRHGFSLKDAIKNSQENSCTNLGAALRAVSYSGMEIEWERIIVITDEQSTDSVSCHNFKNPYLINVSTEKNGIGYGKWKHIDGFSSSVINWMMEIEKFNQENI